MMGLVAGTVSVPPAVAQHHHHHHQQQGQQRRCGKRGSSCSVFLLSRQPELGAFSAGWALRAAHKCQGHSRQRDTELTALAREGEHHGVDMREVDPRYGRGRAQFTAGGGQMGRDMNEDEREQMWAERRYVDKDCEDDGDDGAEPFSGSPLCDEEVSVSRLGALISKACSLEAVEEVVEAHTAAFRVPTVIATLLRLLNLEAERAPGMRSLAHSSATRRLARIAEGAVEEATPLQLAVMARAFALLGYAHLALWDGITAQVRGCSLSQFTPTALADLLWAYGYIGYVPDHRLLDAISAVLAGSGRLTDQETVLLEVSARSSLGADWERWGADGISAGVDTLIPSDLQEGVEALFGGSEEEREERGSELRHPTISPLDSFSSRELCMILCAYGKMGHPAGPLVSGVVAQLLKEGRVAELAGQEIAMLLWAFAKLSARPVGLLDVVAAELHARLQVEGRTAAQSAVLYGARSEWAGYDSGVADKRQLAAEAMRVLASCVWAYGKLNHSPGALLPTVAHAAAPSVPRMSPKDLARMTWGFAKLGAAPPAFLAALVAELGRPPRLASFRPIQVSIIAWSLSLLEYKLPQRELEGLAGYVITNACGFSAQGLANTAWAFVRFSEFSGREAPPGLLAALLEEASGRLGEFEPQGVTEMVKAAAAPAAEGAIPEGFLRRVSEHVVDNIEDYALEDVLNILISFADLGFQSEEMLAAVGAWVDRRLHRLSPQGLSMTLWSFAFTSYANPTLLRTAAEACVAVASEFSPPQIARVLWSFAKLEFHPGALLDELAVQSVAKLRLLAQKELSNVLWAYGRLEHLPTGLLEAAAEWMEPRLSSFSPQAIANIGWAYARLRHRNEALLEALAAQSVAVAPEFTPQGLSMTLYACALQRFRHEALLDALASEVVCRDLSEFDPQNFANLIWGYGKLGADPVPALDCLATAVVERLPAFSGQELFNIVWAFAKLRRTPPARLLDVVGVEMARRVGELTAQELANTVWAYARLEAYHPALFSAVCRQAAAPGRLATFRLQHLINLLWALGQTGHDAGGLLPKLLRELEGRVEEMRPQHLATAVRSLALLRVAPGTAFLARLQARSHATAARFRRFEICGLLWGFAVLGVQPNRLLRLLQPHEVWDNAMRARDKLMPGEMVRGLWALVAMRQYQLPATRSFARRLAAPIWMGNSGQPCPELYAMRDQAFELLEKFSPAVTEALVGDWRDGSNGSGSAVTEETFEVAEALETMGYQAEELRHRSALGWLVPGQRGATLLQPLAADSLIWHVGGGDGWQSLQFSGEALCRQRLLRQTCARHLMATAVLLDTDWNAAKEDGALDARESAIRRAFQHAIPFDRRLGNGPAGRRTTSISCKTAKLLWRTDGMYELT